MELGRRREEQERKSKERPTQEDKNGDLVGGIRQEGREAGEKEQGKTYTRR